MAYTGYFEYAGTEIINVARLRKYKETLGLGWFHPGYEDSQYMETMLGQAYTTPALDSPWLDRDNVDSADFYGVYPIKIQGIEDSTRDAQVTESVLDGGVVGRLREATRSIVFEVALLAGSECGAEYGFNWLKKALKGVNCGPNSTTNCAGNRLDFFSCAPFYDTSGDSSGTGAIYSWVGDANESASQMQTCDAVVRRTNHATDPRATTFATGLTSIGPSDWYFHGVYTTETTSLPPGTDFTTYARKTSNFTGNEALVMPLIGQNNAGGLTVTAGEEITISFWTRYSVTQPAPFLRGLNTFVDGSNVPVPIAQPTITPTVEGVWQRVSATMTVPATAVQYRPLLEVIGTGGNTSGDTLDVTGLMIEKVGTLGTYFDGDTEDTGTCVSIVRANIDGGYWVGGVDVSVDDPLFDGGTPSTAAWAYVFDGGTPSSTGGVLTPPYEYPFDEPQIIPQEPFSPEDCLVEFERHFRNVAFTSGPTITKQKRLTSGDQVWTATFTAVCGVPWQFGSPIDVASGWLGSSFEWGAQEGTYNDVPSIHVDEACLPAAWEPLTDPLCPALIPPPSVPETALGCFSAPSVWTRRQFTVPEDLVPEWGDVVPVLSVSTPFAEMRNLRVRFYEDDGSHVVTETCTPVADFLFQYLPISFTVVVDAEARVVYAVDTLGNQRRADSLVYASDGTPFEWPVLSCGEGLIVTTDLPEDSLQPPEVSLSLVSRGA